jgi:hypothetical protein
MVITVNMSQEIYNYATTLHPHPRKILETTVLLSSTTLRFPLPQAKGHHKIRLYVAEAYET